MEQFVSTHLALLAREHEAELVESSAFLSKAVKNFRELETKGTCISKLTAASQRVGLYGRHIVSFERRGAGKVALPAHNIHSGDIVGVCSGGRSLQPDKLLTGVVTRCSDIACHVAFEDLPGEVDLEHHHGTLQLVKMANEVTYRRMKKALESLAHSKVAANLVSVMFGQSPPSSSPHPHWTHLLDTLTRGENSEAKDSYHLHNPGLDSSQQRAVLFAMSRPDIAIIHGPPGTGKTTTVVEVIMQCVDQNKKVLACAPSNIAVDNLVERLASYRVKLIRLGHPARLVSSVLAHSLDSLLSRSDNAAVINDCRKEMEQAILKSGRSRDPAQRRRWRGEVKVLRKELLQREEKSIRELMRGAQVVLATTTGASLDGPLKFLPEDHFDVVIIDECAQALEASCWIPLRLAPKCVLAGDHMQLPPTILSDEASVEGLSLTLMERLVLKYGDSITSMLTTQYRMHQHIMEWPSSFLYNARLSAHQSVASHLLKDIPNVADTEDTSIPMLLIDTAGCSLHEMESDSAESKGNEGEANLVVHHVKQLLTAGVPASSIAVIAPYTLQVDLIRQLLRSPDSSSTQVEVHTVDGFQGREKEAVVISFTRSNTRGEYGFLKEKRRTNVAVTRARRHLTLIGDSSTISKEPFIGGLLDYCSSYGEVRSAHEYIHDSSYESSSVFTSGGVDNPESKIKRRGGGVVNTTGKMKSACDEAKATVSLRLIYKTKLEEFQQGSEKCLSFPLSLTSHQRKLVHEVAEELGLAHASRGEGNQRYIVVQQSSPETSAPQLKNDAIVRTDGTAASDEEPPSVNTGAECEITELPAFRYIEKEDKEKEEEEEREEEEVVVKKEVVKSSGSIDASSAIPSSGDSKVVNCEICERQIPVGNWTLHKLRCNSQHSKHPQDVIGRHHQPKSSACKAPPRHKARDRVKHKGRQRSTNEDTDLDSLIAEMTATDKRCGYPECRKEVSMLGMKCQFCCRRFCVSHSLPEVHGCGEPAKRHARQQFRTSRGGGGGGKLSSTNRVQLQKKLDKKIDKLSSARSHKKPS